MYNKGITSFWKETGAASVMIARAAEWNASVFRWSTHKLLIHVKEQGIEENRILLLLFENFFSFYEKFHFG